MKHTFFIILVTFSSFISWSAEIRCGDILNPAVAAKNPIAQDLVQRLLTNSDSSNISGAISGSQNATWFTYKWIVDAKKAIQENQLTASDLEPIKPHIETAVAAFEAQEKKTQIADMSYRLYEQFQILNQLLKKKIFPEHLIKYAEKDQDLVQKAVQIVKNNEKRLRDFYHTSGYRNTVDLVNYIENFDSEGTRLLELINDGLVVTIRRPEQARFWIPLTGFQNQRVTGSSKGMYMPSFRNDVESKLTGTPHSDYEKLSVRLMPQYGEARPSLDNTSLRNATSADQYGPDLWVVKKELLETRATWTPSDSFSQPRPNDKMEYWSQMFLPWSHREFMAPYLIEFFLMSKFVPHDLPSSFVLEKAKNSSWYTYVETQIWGPVTLRDIEAFVFTYTPPEKDFVKELESYGVKVIDGRNGEFRPYEVPE